MSHAIKTVMAVQAAMGQDITVGPSNSPYVVPGPTANYDTVTFQTGGYMQLGQQTMLTMQSVIKSS